MELEAAKTLLGAEIFNSWINLQNCIIKNGAIADAIFYIEYCYIPLKSTPSNKTEGVSQLEPL